MSSRLPTTEEILEGNAGAALKSEGLTWKALLASVAYAVTLHYAQVAIFVIIRNRFVKIYRPRTYLVPEQECTQQPPDGALAWLRPVWETPDDQIIRKCGLDAFLFIRYLRMMLKIFLPTMIIVIPILTPINRFSGESERVTSLSQLSISNIAPRYTASRMWAHWAIATLVVGWVCYVVHDETLNYVRTRQRYLLGSGSSSRASSSTILVGNIPRALLTREKLAEVFGVFQGGVKDVYINTDVKELSASLSLREKTLEDVEVALTRLAVRCLSEAAESQKHHNSRTRFSPVKHSQHSSPFGTVDDEVGGGVWRSYIKVNDRETMRLPLLARSWFPSLPMLGKKVDRIDHLLERMHGLNLKVESCHTEATACPPTSSAFIQFHHRIAAHLACQSVIHGVPHHMTPRMLEVDPGDVIWDNLALDWRQRWIRRCVSLAISMSIIVLYAVPIAFTSLLANVDTLAARVNWLSWLTDWPDVIKSVVQGVLPSALLQLLLLLVPVIYRGLLHFQGSPTGTSREIGVQNWHFLFLFVQVFLVVSISGSLIGFLSGAANDPKSVSAELAQTLPRAANYFMSYVLIKALTGSASALLQPCTLLVYCISPFFDVSPRQKWQRQAKLASIEWARLFPPLTNIAVIGIAFSVVAPLVLAFVSFAFALYWIAYRYNVLYVYQYEFDSGGRFFVAAINQLFTGLYVMELCLTGIFFLATGPEGNSTCTAQGIAMISVLFLTVAYQYSLNHTYEALMYYLPVSGDQESSWTDSQSSQYPHAVAMSTDGGKARPIMGNGSLSNIPINCASRSRDASHATVTIRRKACIPFDNIQPTNTKHASYSDGQRQESLALQLNKNTLSPVLWIPQDSLGISKSELRIATTAIDTVIISDRDAFLDDKGNVTIKGCPPS